jgi:hypothetical protein
MLKKNKFKGDMSYHGANRRASSLPINFSISNTLNNMSSFANSNLTSEISSNLVNISMHASTSTLSTVKTTKIYETKSFPGPMAEPQNKPPMDNYQLNRNFSDITVNNIQILNEHGTSFAEVTTTGSSDSIEPTDATFFSKIKQFFSKIISFFKKIFGYS